MTATDETAEAAALKMFLDAQRMSVLAIVGGLDADQLGTPLLPSGWTPLGLIEHLGQAERHWFQRIATGSVSPLPWSDDPEEDDDEDAPFTTRRSPEVVFAFYRDQIDRSNAALASTPLSSRPVVQHPGGGVEDITDLRTIVLHMIEETARHAGHLDAVRELIDGQTGLGPR